MPQIDEARGRVRAPRAYPARPGKVAVEPVGRARERWSPVRFSRTDKVEEDDLTAMMEAARWAPSSMNEQPWRFLVARRTDPWREAVDDALMEGNAWARSASVLLVGMASKTHARNGRPNAYAWHDTGIALGNVLAEAMARGLVTHVMGGVRKDELRDSLGLPPDLDVLWVTAVGHFDPGSQDEGLQKRDGRARTRLDLPALIWEPEGDGAKRPV